MLGIKVQRQPDSSVLAGLEVSDWPIWSHGEATFPWTYDAEETCYILEGEVTVTPAGGEPVRIGKGDMVTFPAGMSCTWEIHQAIRKHYQFA